jgi:hypothetical protein
MIEEVRGGGGGVGLEHQRTSTDDRSNAREAGSGGVVNVKILQNRKKRPAFWWSPAGKMRLHAWQ